jgi:hypothetical protein
MLSKDFVDEDCGKCRIIKITLEKVNAATTFKVAADFTPWWLFVISSLIDIITSPNPLSKFG